MAGLLVPWQSTIFSYETLLECCSTLILDALLTKLQLRWELNPRHKFRSPTC